MSTTRNGAWPDAKPLRRLAYLTLASLTASAVLMLPARLGALAHADDDAPITAAEVGSMASTTSAGTAAPATASIVTSAPAAKAPGAAAPAVPPTVAHADGGAEVSTRPTFARPIVPPMGGPGDNEMFITPSGTQEIPQAAPEEAPVATVPPGAVPTSRDLTNYLNDDSDLSSGVGSVRDFVAEGEESSPIGIEVRETHRRLKSGEEASGLLILKVQKDSPAGKAGLHAYKRAAHNAIEGVAIGAALFFPPAILAIPIIDYTEVGESYDMIIGIDGSRVTNFVDFADRMRDVQAGELVYFSIVRNGRRMQIAVPIPALTTTSASN